MRVQVGWTAVVAVALLLAAAPAIAQPAPSPSPSVDVTGEASDGNVAIDQPTSFTFNVRNTSPEIPGAAAQQAASVDVRVDGVPEGWTASANPASFKLAPGASRAVEVTVAVAPGSSVKEASLTVVADLYSPLEGLEPILGQVPNGAATQHASDSAALEMHVKNTLTRDVLETLGPWVYVLLVLLIAAVLVAVAISVSARRTLVRLVSDTRERPLAPGGKVAFPFRVEGLAKDPDAVLLQVSAVQEGWAAFLPVPELELAPGQTEEVHLVVIAPRGASQGTRQAVLVTATSAKAPKGAANLEFVAVVEGPEELATATRRSKA